MKTIIKYSAILLLVITLVKTADAASFETLGNQWYERRAEGSVGIVARPNPINQAILYYEKALETSSSEEITVALLKSYYFKGSFVQMSTDEQRSIFNKGTVLGEEMVKQYPRSVAIKYWLAAHWGKWAKINGAISAAKAGVADKLRSLSEEIIKLDPNYNDAGGYEILGLVHFYSPHIPFFLTWPSNKIALENLQRAARISPTISNNFCLAQALLKEGNKAMGLSILEKTAAMQPRAEKVVEDRNALKQVSELLAQNKK